MLQLSSTGGVQAGRGALQQGHAHGCVGAMAQRAGGRRRVQHQHHSAPPGPNACRGARHVCAAALGDDAVPASRRAFLAAALTGAVWAQAWDAGVAFAGGASITKVRAAYARACTRGGGWRFQCVPFHAGVRGRGYGRDREAHCPAAAGAGLHGHRRRQGQWAAWVVQNARTCCHARLPAYAHAGPERTCILLPLHGGRGEHRSAQNARTCRT